VPSRLGYRQKAFTVQGFSDKKKQDGIEKGAYTIPWINVFLFSRMMNESG